MPTYIDDVVDPAILAPRLTLGETAQGLLTAIIQPATIATHPFDERCRALVLKDQIKCDQIKAHIVFVGLITL